MANPTLDAAVERFTRRPTARSAWALRDTVDEYLIDDMVGRETHEHWYDETRDYVVDTKRFRAA